MMFDTVLVTGANGWLGGRLVNCLAASDLHFRELRCLILPGSTLPVFENTARVVKFIEGDLRSKSDCASFVQGANSGLVIHAAGVIHPRRIQEFYDVNVTGTRNILDAAAEGGVKRAVVVSSNSPCGCNSHRTELFDENSEYRPYMNYGRSKMLMELAVREIGRMRRLETVIVRAPWFYGPGQPARQTLFFSMIRNGAFPRFGDGNNRRSMVYVDNLCDGLTLAGWSPAAKDQTYWIADERPYTMNQIIGTVERLLRDDFLLPVTANTRRFPGVVSNAAMVADKLIQAIGLYNTKVHVLSEMNKTIACSIEKAERELGYSPRTGLEEGMRRSIAWCLQNGTAI